MLRVRDSRDQTPVVGQHQQPFAVAIEPAGDVDVRDLDKVGQRRPAMLPVGKLGEHVIGLVEQDQAAGPGFLPLTLFPPGRLPGSLPQMWQEAMPRRSKYRW